jgi:hypothetical protein
MDPPQVERRLSGALLKNRYRAVSLLGESGFAMTYLAMDERSFGAKVVVRLPHPGLLAMERFADLFDLEARSLIDLELPHLIRVLDVGEFRGIPFGVVEYASGGSLLQRFAAGEGGLQPAEVVEWLPTVAGALDFLHDRGFVHRDIKPENILFDHSGRVLISDLALAKSLRAYEARTGKIESSYGTPAYLAPEALRRGPAAPAMDQYSLGVVLYQTLCGRLPYDWDAPEALLECKLRTPPRNLATFAPQLPSRAIRAVMKAISMAPPDRFASCAELARAFIEGLGTHRFVPVVPEQPGHRTRSDASSAGAPAATAPRRGSFLVRVGLKATALSAALLLGAGLFQLFRDGAFFSHVEKGAATAVSTSMPASTAEAEALPAAIPRDMAPAATLRLQPQAPPVPRPRQAVIGTDRFPRSADPPRRWKALLEGALLPGWRTVGQIGWTFRDNVLHLAPATVLVTERIHRDLALTLKARIQDRSGSFGVVVRAQNGGRAVKLEFKQGLGRLRLGQEDVPLAGEIRPGEWHQIDLIVRGELVLAYLDRKKAASSRDPAVQSGHLGVYCKQGAVEFRGMFLQSLD